MYIAKMSDLGKCISAWTNTLDLSLYVTSDTVQKIGLYVDEIAPVLQCKHMP